MFRPGHGNRVEWVSNMYKVYGLLLGSLCVVGAAFAFLRSLTGPQFIPPAAGRSASGTGAVVSPVEIPVASPSPDEPLTPLEEYRSTLIRSEQYLRSVDAYSAEFIRQERKEGELLDREEISIKIRHEPFSVYMHWPEDGQQVLYVEGENDGRLLAKRATGFFRRTIRLGPTSRMAMADSRYPIYELGMLKIAINAQAVLAGCPSLDGVDCIVESSELDGLPVRQFTITFPSPESQATYSHCVLCFTEDPPMPVCITCRGWTEDGKMGDLLEHYYYRDLEIDAGLTAVDFDSENEAYAF